MATLNVLNPEAIDALLLRDDPVMGALLVSVLRRPLLRQERGFVRVESYPDDPPQWLTREKFAAGPVHNFVGDGLLNRDIARVELWLSAALARNVPWLRVGPAGPIAQLRNLGELHHILARARKDLQRWKLLPSEEAGNANILPEHVEPFLDASHGRRWMRLKTPLALGLEGEIMRHCVGNSEYVGQLVRGRARFYSLRSWRNRALVTVMTKFAACGTEQITAARAMKNRAPSRYSADIALLAEDLQERRVRELAASLPKASSRASWWYWRYCRDAEEIHEGDFVLEGAREHVDLPRTLHIRGSMTLAQCPHQIALPEMLRVDGDLTIESAAALRALPRWLRVAGDLVLRDCRAVEALPIHCWVGRDLTVENCRRLKRIPQALVIGRYLYVQKCDAISRPPVRLTALAIMVDGYVFRSGRQWSNALRQRRRAG